MVLFPAVPADEVDAMESGSGGVVGSAEVLPPVPLPLAEEVELNEPVSPKM